MLGERVRRGSNDHPRARTGSAEAESGIKLEVEGYFLFCGDVEKRCLAYFRFPTVIPTNPPVTSPVEIVF